MNTSSAKIDFSVIRFLIVDSNSLSLDLMRDVLGALGVIYIRRAADSTKAVQILNERQTDIMITEWDLEPMSGLELIDFIRTSPLSPDRLLPIIMLTAFSEQEYVVQARDKGITEFLAKPFTIDGLYRRLVSVITRPREFVNADGYFGPDRRRRDGEFDGPDRRENT